MGQWGSYSVFCEIYLYTLECFLSKGISPRLLQWSICREEDSGFSKTGSRAEVMWDTVFFSSPLLNIATPPPANTQFPIRGRHKHASSAEMVGGRAKGHRTKENIEKELLCVIPDARIHWELNFLHRVYCGVFFISKKVIFSCMHYYLKHTFVR